MTSMTIDPRLQARRIEVMRLRGRRRLRLLVALATVAAVVATGWWLVMRSPLFDVDTIAIEGMVRTDPAVVAKASGVSEGQPLLEVDVESARESIIELPWVASVTSDRSMTGEVTFTVNERTPVAVVPGEADWLLVDADGRVLEVVSSVPEDVVVVGGSAWAVQPGGWIGEGALPSLDVAALLPGGLRPKVASIQLVATDLELALFGGGRIVLGDTAELPDKFLSAMTLLHRLDLRCLDRIDVRAPSVPVLTRTAACS